MSSPSGSACLQDEHIGAGSASRGRIHGPQLRLPSTWRRESTFLLLRGLDTCPSATQTQTLLRESFPKPLGTRIRKPEG